MGKKSFSFQDIVTQVSDRREKPRISTAAVVKSSLVLFWARMAASTLGNRSAGPFLAAVARRADLQRRHSGTRPCTARCPRAASRDSRRLRRLKRNKALPDIYGLGVVVLDGHEATPVTCVIVPVACSEPPRCGRRSYPVLSSAGHLAVAPSCAARTGGVRLLLDHEPQRPARMKWKRPCAYWRA